MIEVVGDLWTYPADVRIITTNGTVNSRGECVMGRGCALEAKTRYPELPKALAAKIRKEGNHPYSFSVTTTSSGQLITFPVKHQWFERADPILIRTSVLQLKRMIDPALTYVMPRPGCGNGGREWREVKPLLADLPDNVHVIDFPPAATSSQSTSQPSAA